MKIRIAVALICLSLFTPSFFGQTPPPIPEEARKHFVMGTTLFKDSKTHDDFLQAASEFKQATDLAPQWPEARYNLALAKESAKDYSGAIADLKIYQKFGLSDIEARTVQDKIYELEAKQGASEKKQLEERNAAAAEKQKQQDHQDKVGFLEGTWNCHVSFKQPNGTPKEIDSKVKITVSDRVILFTSLDSAKPFVKGELTAEDYTSIKWMALDDTDDKNYRGAVIEAAPAISITISINKSPLQIHWRQPQLMMDLSRVSWTTQYGEHEFTLTR
jgi:hypothetical protein